jgi:preprotein translocase subunit SecG
MNILVTIIHILACISLIFIVLLQSGKGASMGAAFGGSSQTVFGSSGPKTFLGKMTTIMAVVFMLTSLGLTIFSGNKGSSSIMNNALTPPAQSQTLDQAAPAPEQNHPAAEAGEENN